MEWWKNRGNNDSDVDGDEHEQRQEDGSRSRSPSRPEDFQHGREVAEEHFAKHRDDFPNLNSVEEYVQEATDFVQNPPDSALQATRLRDRTTVVYDPGTNRIGFLNEAGETASYYKPDLSTHDFSTNMEYFFSVIE